MSASQRPLVLASASPRRKDILSTLGVVFTVRPSGADEAALDIEGHTAFVRGAAELKLGHALRSVDDPSTFVLAADTIVCVDGRRLGKPVDDADALRMLSGLQGREHRVKTAVALGNRVQGALETRVVETRVWFRDATEDELRRYVRSGEGVDKAGSYGIQGLASGLIARIDGCYTNVVGLPASETLSMLLRHSVLGEWP